MTSQLNRFQIKSRIYGGFGVLIALTVVLALFSTFELASVRGQVVRLLSLFSNTTRVLEAGRLLETLRRSALTYKTSEDDSAVHVFEDARAQARELMQAASQATLSRERFGVYQEVLAALDALEPKFRQLEALGATTKAARAKLYTVGDELTAATQRLIDEAVQSEQRGLAEEATRFESTMLLVRVANWRFLATRDPKGPDIFKTNVERAERALVALQQRAQIGVLRTAVSDVSAGLTAYRQSFEAVSSSLLQADEQYATGIAPALATMQQQLEAARRSLAEDSANTQAATSRQLSGTLWLQILVAIALLALGLWMALAIARGIVRPLSQMTGAMMSLAGGDLDTPLPSQEGADELAAMGRAVQVFKDNELARRDLEAEIATGAIANTQKIAATQATASEIAATVTEIGATSKEISATSRELVKTIGEVAVVAEQSATLASSGQAGLGHMESTMRSVMEAASGINAKLAVLNEKASNINQVVVTITKVADQTNLLSLNAAIEAEKAGEAGRGFSVVATEIRRLADQTAVATYDIEQMVKEIQSAVAAGVMGMDKFSEEVRRGMHEVQQVGTQLSEIIQQVQALAPRVEAVNEGMQAQASGAEQITQALTQLNEATQQTVESLRQSSVAIDELNKVATGLRNGLSRASSLKPGRPPTQTSASRGAELAQAV